MTRAQRLRLRLAAWWWSTRDWFARWIFAQHNARVLVDFERRMSAVICAATGSMMSKPYYTTEVMLAEIEAERSRAYDRAYAEGRKDLAEELGVEDPSPMVPEGAER